MGWTVYGTDMEITSPATLAIPAPRTPSSAEIADEAECGPIAEGYGDRMGHTMPDHVDGQAQDELARLILQGMQKHKMSYEKLSAATGIPHSWLHRLVNGSVKLNSQRIAAITQALRLTPEEVAAVDAAVDARYLIARRSVSGDSDWVRIVGTKVSALVPEGYDRLTPEQKAKLRIILEETVETMLGERETPQESGA